MSDHGVSSTASLQLTNTSQAFHVKKNKQLSHAVIDCLFFCLGFVSPFRWTIMKEIVWLWIALPLYRLSFLRVSKSFYLHAFPKLINQVVIGVIPAPLWVAGQSLCFLEQITVAIRTEATFFFNREQGSFKLIPILYIAPAIQTNGIFLNWYLSSCERSQINTWQTNKTISVWLNKSQQNTCSCLWHYLSLIRPNKFWDPFLKCLLLGAGLWDLWELCPLCFDTTLSNELKSLIPKI